MSGTREVKFKVDFKSTLISGLQLEFVDTANFKSIADWQSFRSFPHTAELIVIFIDAHTINCMSFSN